MTETWEPELCDDKPEEFTKTNHDTYIQRKDIRYVEYHSLDGSDGFKGYECLFYEYMYHGKYAGEFYGEYSGARNRDSYGRYSRDTDWMVETLHEMRDKAPNDQMRKEFDEFIMRMDRVK